MQYLFRWNRGITRDKENIFVTKFVFGSGENDDDTIGGEGDSKIPCLDNNKIIV